MKLVLRFNFYFEFIQTQRPRCSYAAVVGSIGRTGMPYMMSVQAQEKAAAGAAEIVQNLDLVITKMLITFRNKTRMKAAKIIVFRGIYS